MKKEQIAQAVTAVTVGLTQLRKRKVKFLQPYFKQGNRWFKLNAKRK